MKIEGAGTLMVPGCGARPDKTDLAAALDLLPHANWCIPHHLDSGKPTDPTLAVISS